MSQAAILGAKRKKSSQAIYACDDVVKMNGFEPSTPCMSSKCSNQLSYTFKNIKLAEREGFEPSKRY